MSKYKKSELSRSKLNCFLDSNNNCNNSSSSSSSSTKSVLCKKCNTYKSCKHTKKSSKCKSTYTTTNSCSSSSSKCCPSTSSNSCFTTSSSSCPTTSSSSCPTTSSSSCPSSSSSNCCPSSSSSCSTTSSSSCNPCKVKCNPYQLKCNTYKSLGGSILIPGPQGPSSGSLANMSANDNNVEDGLTLTQIASTLNYSIQLDNFTGVNISSANNQTFTFSLSGTYLCQYNLYSTYPSSPPSFNTQLLVNNTTSYGVQTIASNGSYGCSVIITVNAGDYINLVVTNNNNFPIKFASLTIIKL
jgi:hypothetical protein